MSTPPPQAHRPRHGRARTLVDVLSLAVGLGVLLGGCAARPRAAATAAVARPGEPVYRGTVAIDPAAGTLDATWQIDFVPPADVDSVVLLLNPRLRVDAMRGTGTGTVRVATDSEYTRVTVPLATRGATPRTVALHVRGAPAFSDDRINGIGPDWVELGLDSYWYPVFADFADRVTARIAVRLPARWPIAAGAAVRWQGDSAILDQTVPQVDIAFAAAPGLRRVGDRDVGAFVVATPDSLVRRVLDIAAPCRASLNAQFGAREAIPVTSFVLAPRSGPGYARGHYIVLNNEFNATPAALTSFVCHELAHFWSRRAVASGPENWLNEGFAEYVAAREVRRALGDSTYAAHVASWAARAQGGGPIWTPSATRRPSAVASYRKAPLLLHRLEERIGREKTDAVLRRYMVDGIRTTPALIDAIATIAGDATARWFTDELAR